MANAIRDYSEELNASLEYIKKARKDRAIYNEEKQILESFELRYKLLYSQIHLYLFPLKTERSEKEIRKLVGDIILYDLTIVQAKAEMFERACRQVAEKNEKKALVYFSFMQRWQILLEKLFALASFRSLEHFAQYMEWEAKDHDKVWKYSLDPYNDGGITGVNKPFFHYFARMALKQDIKFISKQMPTGTGKSFSNQVAIAWLLGIDKQNDCLIVLGNPSLVLTNTKGIAELMCSKRFADVFPEYQKYHDMGGDIKANIFSVCRMKDGDLTLADTTRPQSVKIISKDTSIDGIRVKFLFLDDVCRSKDANNLKQHETDINNFWNSWYKRNYGTDNFYIVAGGTAYSVEDILSHLIRHYSKNKLYKTYNEKKCSGNKYTYTNEEQNCIFIKIPKIDDEFNRSTYPQKFPYAEAVKLRELNPRSFMAMEQQQPQNPETTPLAYDKISTYKELPNDLSSCATALIDPARSGKNYVSMPIFKTREEIDKYGNPVQVHYFVDCIYQLKQMEELHDYICEKIIKHNIIKLYVETNTDTSLPATIERILFSKGYRNFKIEPFYSYEVKDSKLSEVVYTCENMIQRQFKFPEYGLYAPSHEIGKFMQNVTNYDYQVKMEYDDGIESLCEYARREIKQNIQNNKAQVIYV